MAAFIITDLGNDIQVHRTGDIADSKYTFNKSSLRVKQTANQVLITNSDSFQSHKDNLVFELDYQKVTSPVYASNDELYAGILSMILSSALLEHLVSVSGVGDGVTSRYEILMNGFQNLSIHIKLVSTNAADTITLTVWATNNSAADDTGDAHWVNISSTILGAASKAANNTTTEEIFFVDTDVVPLKYMVKIVTTSGGTDTNAADVYINKAS